MKTVIFSGVVFILIILSIVLSSLYTTAQYKIIDGNAEKIRQLIIEDDWEKSEELFKTTYNKWKKSETTLSILFRHEEIDDIDESMQKLGAYISLREKSDSLTEITILSFNVLHLREKDKLQLENLF